MFSWNQNRYLWAGLLVTLGWFLAKPGSSPSQQAKLSEPVPEFRTIAFSADGKLLAAGSGEPEEHGVVTVWDVKSRRPLFTHREKRGVPSVAFSPDGKLLAVGIFADQCRLIDVATGKVHALLPGHNQAARSVAFSPDGKTLAVGSYDRTIRLWDLATLQVHKSWQAHGNWVWGLAYSADGAWLASGSDDSTVKLWELPAGKHLKTWRTPNRHLTFVPHSRMLASIGYDGAVKILDPTSGKIRATFGGAGTEDLSFTADGKTVAACGQGLAVNLYSVNLRHANDSERKQINDLIARLDDDDYDVREKSSQDLLRLGPLAEPFLYQALKETKSAEVRIRARRLRKRIRSPEADAVLRGHQDQVLCLAFSPDGKTLASSGKEGVVYLWDFASRKQIATLATR